MNIISVTHDNTISFACICTIYIYDVFGQGLVRFELLIKSKVIKLYIAVRMLYSTLFAFVYKETDLLNHETICI